MTVPERDDCAGPLALPGAHVEALVPDPHRPPPWSGSLVFPRTGDETAVGARPTDAGCLRALNLQRIFDAVVGHRQDRDLMVDLLSRPVRDADTVVYRQEIFDDLADPELLETLRSFTEQVRQVRARLVGSSRMQSRRQREGWFLSTAQLYCDAVRELADRLSAAPLRSRGLNGLRDHLHALLESPDFRELVQDTNIRKREMAGITYCIGIDGLQVQVEEYLDEPDYGAEIEDTFERFRRGSVRAYRATYRGEISINHVGAQILDRVARLHPEQFAALTQYCRLYADLIDPTLEHVRGELQFYLAYLDHIAPLQKAGLSFCLPQLATRDKQIHARDTFDLALAGELLAESRTVVTNDFHLSGQERIFVVSGPNQGGKTTFARAFGQAHHLAAVGCPVPGSSARLFLFDRMFSHFAGVEDPADLRGKLELDLLEVRAILRDATGDSIVVLNELFTSTTLTDARFLGGGVLDRMIASEHLGVYVTFVEELTRRGDRVVSMISTTAADPTQRTFRIIRGPADGSAHAVALAAAHRLTGSPAHRLTYEQLKARVVP